MILLDVLFWALLLAWILLPAAAAWAIRRSKRTVWIGMAFGWVAQFLVGAFILTVTFIEVHSGDEGALEGPVWFSALMAIIVFSVIGSLAGILSASFSARYAPTGRAT